VFLALALPRFQCLIEGGPLGGSGLLVLLPDREVDLLAIDPDVRWRLDTQTNLVPLHFQDAHGDRVPDADHLAQLPCQDQHCPGLPAPIAVSTIRGPSFSVTPESGRRRSSARCATGSRPSGPVGVG